jgi:hypothetical protein
MRYNWDIEVYALTTFPNMLVPDGRYYSANKSQRTEISVPQPGQVVFLVNMRVTQLFKKFPMLMEPKGSQEPTTEIYLEVAHSTTLISPFPNTVLIFSSSFLQFQNQNCLRIYNFLHAYYMSYTCQRSARKVAYKVIFKTSETNLLITPQYSRHKNIFLNNFYFWY